MTVEKYTDRAQAGKILAKKLRAYANRSDRVVLALPRGGVPIGFEVARALKAPLDVLVVRKLGVPGNSELAMGAIAMNGIRMLNEDLIQELQISPSAIDRVTQVEQQELERRESAYRGNRPPLNLIDKTVILVDDGMATGATMRVAVKAVRALHPAHIVIAIPVAARDTCQEMLLLVDELICPLIPEHFYTVGTWYEDFPQTSDEEVCHLLGANHDSLHPH